MSVQLENSILQRFNSLFWHDSKLVGVSLFKVNEEDRVKLSLELLGEDGTLTPAEIIFKECVYFQIDFYLAAKSMCADDISNAKCYEPSECKKHGLGTEFLRSYSRRRTWLRGAPTL